MRFKTFCINLENHDFRRDHVLAQAEKAGLDIHIFTAITPETSHTVPHRYNETKARRFTGRPMLPTEIACTLSHFALWDRLLQDSEVDHYLILEDDVTFHNNISTLLKNIDLSAIDLLKLSGKQKRPFKHIQQIGDTHTVVKFAYGPLDCAAYIISKKGAQVLRPYCETIFTPIDIMMDRSYDHGIAIYGIVPYPIQADFCFDPDSPFYTSIGDRDQKYADDLSFFDFVCVRIQRLIGSLKRKFAKVSLRFI